MDNIGDINVSLRIKPEFFIVDKIYYCKKFYAIIKKSVFSRFNLYKKFMPTLAYNKRANFDYEITERFEAGLALYGHEAKAVKTGHISLKGSFVVAKKTGAALPELYLINAHIPLYKKASTVKNYDPTRSRKLLLRKKQIAHLIGKKEEQGLTLVPIRVYTIRNLVKLEFGVGRGKKKYDKRETIKKRETERKVRTLMKHNSRL